MPIPLRTGARTILAAMLLLAGQRAAAAQPAPPTFADLRTTMWGGETVSVVDRAGMEMKGRVLAISDASITLLVQGPPHEALAKDVAWISRRSRNTGRGALMGLAVGATIGVISGFHGTSCQPGYSDCGNDMGWVLVLGAMLGGMGGGVGAAVGAIVRPEHVLYVAPTPSTSRPAAPYTRPGVISVRAHVHF